MLASTLRLRRPGDINRVYQRGKFGPAGQIQVKAARNGLTASRAVIVVSRKISKQAVRRNRLRRQLSAQLEVLWPQIRPGYDIVVTVRQEITRSEPAALKELLIKALARCDAIQT